MSTGYRSTGLFLAPGEGAGWGAELNPYRNAGSAAGLNPYLRRGSTAGLNPYDSGGHFAGLNPYVTGGHFVGLNPDPVLSSGFNPYASGVDDQPQRAAPALSPSTASPWPWRNFDPAWTYAGGGDALMAQALRKVRTRLIGEGDARRSKATMGQVTEPVQKAAALWRWGSEFRQQAVVCELLNHTLVKGSRIYVATHDFNKKVPVFAAHQLFALEPPGDGFDYGQQIDKVLRAAVEREERLPEILTQAMDFRPFFNSLCGLDRAPTPHVDELVLVAWAWATHVVMALKNNVAEYRPVQRSTLVMPVIGTPNHGSMPSGHATLAVITAQVLAALLYRTPNDPRAQVLLRLASRIAFNRVVAGVHFPMDSFVGARLGAQLAALFVVMAQEGGGLVPKLRPVELKPDSQWREDDLSDAEPEPRSKVAAPTVASLQALWRAAQKELNDLRF